MNGDTSNSGENFSHDTQGVTCTLCPRACKLQENQHGFCFGRKNIHGKIESICYGKCTGMSIDPVEKKPLYHFYPGSKVLSFGTVGCNLECIFCQNWTISRCRDESALRYYASPAEIAAAAKHHGCRSVAYTYNEPIIWAEYAKDTAKECKEYGIKNIAVSAGYIAPEARNFWTVMDAVNLDLKGFTEEFYHKYCHAHLKPVLENLKWLAQETSVWLEVTNLIIPGANDSAGDIMALCDWMVKHLGENVPLHFSAFRPSYRLVDRCPTPLSTLKMAYQIAQESGIRYVYLGNVMEPSYEATICPSCKQVILQRDRFKISYNGMNGTSCSFCGTEISGNFL
ncbi:MAG: AmmeMemoRadiSam system radical SAM enzyme [Planctomycetia bacterium]|nr:AmmeMemoRadiSam system radical SAM enzyme [Planctomycetia bacterium]